MQTQTHPQLETHMQTIKSTRRGNENKPHDTNQQKWVSPKVDLSGKQNTYKYNTLTRNKPKRIKSKQKIKSSLGQ